MLHPPRPGGIVGRAVELAQVVAALGIDDPAAATSRAVLLGGDAGIGKTRLLSELGAHARDAGWRVLAGHCLDLGDDEVPSLPLTEMFGRLDAEVPDRTEQLVAAHPAVRRLLPRHRQRTSDVPVPLDRAELIEGVLGALTDLAADAPLLVVVEDAHWADQSTRDVLSVALARQSDVPLRFVVSYRSDDLHRRHPLRPVIAQWTRVTGVERVQLDPLGEPDVRLLVRDLGAAALGEADVAEIVDRADGNAFFVEELVGAVAAGGLPLDLADLLLVRLEQLDDGARRVVRTASVAGRRVSHALLDAVADTPDADLDAALRSAVERHVLVADESGRYAFRHALLAEAVYDDLMPGERTRLHGAYARALGSGAVEGSAAELARHARLSGQRDVAVRASLEAGDEAMRVGGPGEAGRHYERALELLGEGEVPDGVDVLALTLRAAQAAVDGGHVDRAVAMLRDALDHLPASASVARRARLLAALADAALVADTGVDPWEVAIEAHGLLDDLDDDEVTARVLAVYARAAPPETTEATIVEASRAIDLAERSGQSRLATDLRVTLARLEERLGDPDGARHVLEDVVRQARRDGDAVAELRAGYHLATMRMEGGDPAGAVPDFAAVAERARVLRHTWAPFGVDAWVLQVVSSYMAGDWDGALAVADLSGSAAPPVPAAMISTAAMLVRAGRGDATAIGPVLASRGVWEREGFVAILAAGAGVELMGDAGDVEGALAFHDEAVALLSRTWEPRFSARVRFGAVLLGVLARHVSAAGPQVRAAWLERAADVEEVAGVIATREGPRQQGVESQAWLARTHAERLRLRRAAGEAVDADDLVAAWERTVAAFEAAGHVYESARSRARLAAALRTAGRQGDADVQASAAREVATRLRARPLLAELSLLRGPGRAAAPSTALTPRELEVLALVAEGRTNGEIGTRLFISTKTVSVHVSNVLAKLGASGRTEAASLARRRGLLPD
ncbi:helix-turn-helix transcriptional regulator [Solicola sp. PLA-1-18]|uniref:helix-turn-helix transcriptional regulator n=1 Tax=Solicola sp. PLA-1-18 TaxID=3380532 RepID=UPI003B7AEA1A